MGAACTKENAAAEGSRNDSPDPIMYDLMRKSIQATMSKTGGAADTVTAETFRRKSNNTAGQHHLLFKNNGSSTAVIVAGGSGGSPAKTKSRSKDGAKAKGKIHKDSSPVPAPPHSAGRKSSSSHSIKQKSTGNANSGKSKGSSSRNDKTKFSATEFTPMTAASLETPLSQEPTMYPTRLIIRRRSLRAVEEGMGTHIYAIRYPEDTSPAIVSDHVSPVSMPSRQEQCPPRTSNQQQSQPTEPKEPQQSHQTQPSQQTRQSSQLQQPLPHNIPSQQYNIKVAKYAQSAFASISSLPPPIPTCDGDVFTASAMAAMPRQPVVDWVTVSEEHSIYIADVGMSAAQCDHIVATTEQVCRGQYAAYTYAKQTLGCREFPILAQNSFHPVHATVHEILGKLQSKECQLQLDDREPHIVKYDVTKKERQKLDMHTDKSEWTFLIALSNGCGVDYEGGGTYFECLDATIHIQRGHALIFPGKLRHCGQKITNGLRFLLVGFLVDKMASIATSQAATSTGGPAVAVAAAATVGTKSLALASPKSNPLNPHPTSPKAVTNPATNPHHSIAPPPLAVKATVTSQN